MCADVFQVGNTLWKYKRLKRESIFRLEEVDGDQKAFKAGR